MLVNTKTVVFSSSQGILNNYNETLSYIFCKDMGELRTHKIKILQTCGPLLYSAIAHGEQIRFCSQTQGAVGAVVQFRNGHFPLAIYQCRKSFREQNKGFRLTHLPQHPLVSWNQVNKTYEATLSITSCFLPHTTSFNFVKTKICLLTFSLTHSGYKTPPNKFSN